MMEVSSHDMMMFPSCWLNSCSYREMTANDLAIVEVCRRQRGDDPALVHDVTALRHRADHVEILLDENDGDVGLAIKVDDGAGDILDDRWLDAFRWFVEQDQRRVTDHDAPDRQLLLLAAGQRSGLLGAPLGENGKRAVDPPVISGLDLAAGHFADLEVFLDTHARKNVATLRHVADAEAGAATRDPRAHLPPLENHGALCPRQHPHQ